MIFQRSPTMNQPSSSQPRPVSPELLPESPGSPADTLEPSSETYTQYQQFDDETRNFDEESSRQAVDTEDLEGKSV